MALQAQRPVMLAARDQVRPDARDREERRLAERQGRLQVRRVEPPLVARRRPVGEGSKPGARTTPSALANRTKRVVMVRARRVPAAAEPRSQEAAAGFRSVAASVSGARAPAPD